MSAYAPAYGCRKQHRSLWQLRFPVRFLWGSPDSVRVRIARRSIAWTIRRFNPANRRATRTALRIRQSREPAEFLRRCIKTGRRAVALSILYADSWSLRPLSRRNLGAGRCCSLPSVASDKRRSVSNHYGHSQRMSGEISLSSMKRHESRQTNMRSRRRAAHC
jgi:hypothetical protein